MGQTSYSPPKKFVQAYGKIISLQTVDLKDLAHGKKPVHPFYYYSYTLQESIILLTHNQKNKYQKYLNQVEKFEEQIRKYPDSHPYKKFCLAEIKLQSAFIRLKFGDRFMAAWEIRSAYYLIQKNKTLFPHFIPNNKTSGLLWVILGMVPDQYQWILNFIGMEGSIITGIKDLQKLDQSLFHEEGLMLRALIKGYITNNSKKALELLTQFCSQNPEHLLGNYLMGMVMVKNNASQNAHEILNNRNWPPGKYISWPYMAYLQGEIYLQKGQYKNAINHYLSFIQKHKGQHLLKDAHFKIFLAYHVSGYAETAEKFYEICRKKGTVFTSADKYAHYMVSNNIKPHPYLMKIRLATDGGFYQRADSLLKKARINDFKTSKNRLAFIYRNARKLHLTGDTLEAITHYQKVINASPPENFYFAPNSCLQLGYIYKTQKAYNKALGVLKKIPSYRHYPYEESISKKARILKKEISGIK